MGLSDDEFLDYPANLIFALRKRHLVQMQREELLLAQINCTIGNFSFGGAKTPLTPDKFMFHPIKKSKPTGTLGDNLLAQIGALPPGVVTRVE